MWNQARINVNVTLTEYGTPVKPLFLATWLLSPPGLSIISGVTHINFWLKGRAITTPI